jgi:hypothetical protein
LVVDVRGIPACGPGRIGVEGLQSVGREVWCRVCCGSPEVRSGDAWPCRMLCCLRERGGVVGALVGFYHARWMCVGNLRPCCVVTWELRGQGRYLRAMPKDARSDLRKLRRCTLMLECTGIGRTCAIMMVASRWLSTPLGFRVVGLGFMLVEWRGVVPAMVCVGSVGLMGCVWLAC